MNRILKNCGVNFERRVCLRVNRISGEEVYVMHLSCNDLEFDICINKQDLYGEPQVGRRFKGVIWMQGFINYPTV